MPLVGVKCSDPRHKGETYSFEECLSCNRSGGPRRCEAMYALISAMAKNKVERRDAGLSITTILNKCPRQVILQQEHDYYEEPIDYFARFRGTLGHLLMETYDEGGPGIIQEVRFRKTIVVDGQEVELTGKMDHVDTNRRLIIDYKSCKSVDAKPINQGLPKEGHTEQVNCYRWLLWGGTNMETGEVVHYPIEHGGIHYFSMAGLRKVQVDIWSLAKTEEFIANQLRPIIRYQAEGALPPVLPNAYGKRHWMCNYCPVREQCDSRT